MDSLTTTSLKLPEDIAKAWKGISEAKPGIRIREAAASLALSEAELLATKAGTEVIRLKPEWEALVKQLPGLGSVMSLTRNDACILEHKGTFDKINIFGEGDHRIATVVGPIETRVFFKSWHIAFAVKQKKAEHLLTSLQVFDHAGQAVTKIYLQEDSDYGAYEMLVDNFRAADQSRQQKVFAYGPDEYISQIDKEAFLKDWAALQDPHDFYPLLNHYNVHRHYAIKLAEGTFSYPLAISDIQKMLEKASRQKLPIMVFAGNRGNLQIHQDKVRTIRLLERGHSGEEKWLNVLDPDFNMHLRIDLIKSVWIVTKPTADGKVTSIECYDISNQLSVQFFGLRKPGNPELQEWRELVYSLSPLTIKI